LTAYKLVTQSHVPLNCILVACLENFDHINETEYFMTGIRLFGYDTSCPLNIYGSVTSSLSASKKGCANNHHSYLRLFSCNKIDWALRAS